MKEMKKSIVFLFLCLFLASSTAINAFCHSGDTDASGGHIDRSTGEYHYHHGYPAHDHYDMDEDGDVDCPYNFVDQTGVNSDSSSSNSSYYGDPPSNNDNVIIKTEVVTKTVTKEVPYIPSWVYWVITTLSATVIIMLFVVRRKCKDLSDQAQQFEQNAAEEEARVKNGIIALHNALTKEYGKDYLYVISNAPDGDYVDSDLLPHSANYSINTSCDNYTFFLGSSPYNYSSKFHHSSCRYGRYKINAYTIRKHNNYQSCAVCSSSLKLPNMKWVDEYLRHYKFLSKYVALHTNRHQTQSESKAKSSPNESVFDDPSIKVNWRGQ